MQEVKTMHNRKKQLVALICGVFILGGLIVGGVVGWQKYQEWHALRFARSVDAWMDRNLKHPEYKKPNLGSFLYPETFAEKCHNNIIPNKNPLFNLPEMCSLLIHYTVPGTPHVGERGMTTFVFDPDSGAIIAWIPEDESRVLKTRPPIGEYQLYFQ